MPGHRYNDDLLLRLTDQAQAEAEFKDVAHLLNWSELQSFFVIYDKPANVAKKNSLQAGYVAVVFAVVSLLLASAEPLYTSWPPVAHKALSIVAAALGLVALFVGVTGLLVSGAKRTWLMNCFVTERTRQFHFQAFVCGIELLAANWSHHGSSAFTEYRDRHFATLTRTMTSKGIVEFREVVASQDATGLWLLNAPVAPAPAVLDNLPDAFFQAYKELRLAHQKQYAFWKVGESVGFIQGSGLKLQEWILGNAILVCVMFLLGVHILLIVDAVFASKEFSVSLFHMLSLWAAIVALGARMLEEGLQPKRELERYESYYAATKSVLDRYEGTDSRIAKYDLMVEMERLAFQEMCDFLRAGMQARFVM